MCIVTGCKTWLIPASTTVIIMGGGKAHLLKDILQRHVDSWPKEKEEKANLLGFTPSESELRKRKQDNMLRTICFPFPAKCLLSTTRKK